MPLYRYYCTHCDIEFEKFMTMNEKCDVKTQIFCPDCGGGKNESLVSKTSFVLKGTGWHRDGYTDMKNEN